MRNGNFLLNGSLYFKGASSYPTYEEWKRMIQQNNIVSITIVLILPMRNGNIQYTGGMETRICSYPTYEEWKRTTDEVPPMPLQCSYPTYEEWKPYYDIKPCFF